MILTNATYLTPGYHFETKDLYITNGHIYTEKPDKNEIHDVMDCRDYIVIPGLVNGHFHSYSPLAKGLMKDMALEDWVDTSVQGTIQQAFFTYLDEKMTEDDLWILSQKSYIDMVQGGVTFVSESDPLASPAIQKKIIENIGIRGMVDAYEDLQDGDAVSTGKVRLGSHLLEEENMTEEAFQDCQQVQQSLNPVMMTHCLESRWRHDLVYSSFGTSSVALYEEKNLLNPKAVLFHGVHMSEKDLATVNHHRASVIHCPISNAVTGAGAANISAMLRQGINVGIGTDFDHTDMWEDMRMAYYLLKLQAPIEAFKAEDVWKMATENGAKAYQLGDTAGQINDGYEADLALIKKDTSLAVMLNQKNFSTYAHNLLMSCTPSSIHHVMVQGEWVMNDQKMVRVDESRVLKRYEEIIQELMVFMKNQVYKPDATEKYEA